MKPRFDDIAILQLADAVDDDGCGNVGFLFNTVAGEIELHHCYLDGDTSVTLKTAAQKEAIVDCSVVGCERIIVVDDKRGQYLEIAGQHRVEDYSRGKLQKTAGFRLRLQPYVCIEPFYRAGEPGSDC